MDSKLDQKWTQNWIKNGFKIGWKLTSFLMEIRCQKQSEGPSIFASRSLISIEITKKYHLWCAKGMEFQLQKASDFKSLWGWLSDQKRLEIGIKMDRESGRKWIEN